MINGIFAKPGSGKTIYLALAALKSKRENVFSTSFIRGTRKLDFDELAEKQLPENSLVLIDEITSYADNRDFKSTKKELIRYITNHRHYSHDIIWCSQHYDAVDKKIRTNTQNLYSVGMVGVITWGTPNKRPLLGWYAK